MADRATANLPSRSLPATEAFYRRRGFQSQHHNNGWMILRRGDLGLEFLPFPDIDIRTRSFSACLRDDDMTGLPVEWQSAGLPANPQQSPRLTGVFKPEGAPRMFAVIDEDGSLLRVMDNRDAGEEV